MICWSYFNFHILNYLFNAILLVINYFLFKKSLTSSFKERKSIFKKFMNYDYYTSEEAELEKLKFIILSLVSDKKLKKQ